MIKTSRQTIIEFECLLIFEFSKDNILLQYLRSNLQGIGFVSLEELYILPDSC